VRRTKIHYKQAAVMLGWQNRWPINQVN